MSKLHWIYWTHNDVHINIYIWKNHTKRYQTEKYMYIVYKYSHIYTSETVWILRPIDRHHGYTCQHGLYFDQIGIHMASGIDIGIDIDTHRIPETVYVSIGGHIIFFWPGKYVLFVFTGILLCLGFECRAWTSIYRSVWYTDGDDRSTWICTWIIWIATLM